MFSKKLAIVSWTAALFCIIGLATAADDAKKEDVKKPSLTAEQRQKHLDSFDYVWKAIADTYWDPKFGGLDWPAVRDELRPKVEKAESKQAVRLVLLDMLGRLKRSHFTIISNDVFAELDAPPVPPTKDKNEPVVPATADKPKRRGQGVAGFDVRVVDGKAIVTRVEKGTPAAELGVKPGWQILKIADRELAPSLAKIQAAYKDSTYLEFQNMVALAGRLSGSVGEKVAMTFLKEKDEEAVLDVPLCAPIGSPATFANVPTFYVRFENGAAGDNIGYIALSAFFDPVNIMKKFEQAVQANMKADGIVLDLRGNPGGIAFMAIGVGNWFIAKEDQKLGTMTTRTSALNFVLNPRLETYSGPLAILVDGCSMSTSEFLAGGLQDLGRARIFGTRTPGAALPSRIDRLPNGDGFQYAFANYVSAGGRELEGHGVKPDVEVRPDRTALLSGQDPVIAAAVKWIKSQKK